MDPLSGRDGSRHASAYLERRTSPRLYGRRLVFRNFDRPAGVASTHVQLHFGATFYKSRIWLNGVEVGSHEGGFTAYAFDVTPHLLDHNYLAVRIDNRPGIADDPRIRRQGHAPILV